MSRSYKMHEKAGEYNSNNRNFQLWRQDNHPIHVYSNNVIDEKPVSGEQPVRKHSDQVQAFTEKG